ncbi:MAG: DUF3568 family protein [Opitutaceae bacterium]|nr:DUF3568 family protein [Opitutaceae bacterium]
MKTVFSSFRSWPVLVVAGLMLGVGPGCTQVQVAPNVQGEFKPGLGELQVFADRDFAAVHAATKKAIKDLGLFETQDEKKLVEADLRARDSADTMITVKIKEVAKNRTSVKIRYGLVGGDLANAQRVYQAIQKHL